MNLFLILNFNVVFFLSSHLNAQTLTKFQWKDLGSQALQVFDFDLSPMPVEHPGVASVRFVADLSRSISGPLKTKLSVVRTISGLSLPIRWFGS